MGVVNPLDSRKWRFIRPTSFNWDDISFNIKPIAGQQIRIREFMQVEFQLVNIPPASHIWLNRFHNEAFVGHFQVTRENPFDPGGYITTEKGQIIGSSNNTTFFDWVFSREYDLNLYIKTSDLNPASLSAVYNCNADLAPGPVENRYVNPSNAGQYLEIAYFIAQGQLVQAGKMIDNLLLPVTAGYRFPDNELFKVKNQIPTVELGGYELTTRLGDIEIWIHPDWEVQAAAGYGMEIINYSLLDTTTEQFPDGAVCSYPAGINFP